TFLGLRLEVPFGFTPALVCDLERGWSALALQVSNSNSVILSTDLWLEHKKSGVVEPVSGTDRDAAPENAKRQPLLQLKATPQSAFAIALVMVDNGKAAFFRLLKTTPIQNKITNATGQEVVPAGHLLLAARIDSADSFANNFDITPSIDTERIL